MPVRLRPFPWLLLLALTLSGCALLVPKLQTPRLSVVNIELRQASLLQQRLRVRVRVENPNDRSLPIQGLSYTLSISGQAFASGASEASFVVPALGTAEFDMDVTANAAGALFTILAKPPGQSIDYQMKGRVELSRGWLRSIPFEQNGSFVLR